MTTIHPVDAAFTAFQSSPNTMGVWPTLSRLSLIKQLQFRCEDPYCVDQQDMYLCGPAAIVFLLFRKDPARGVRICQVLFETGAIPPPLTHSQPLPSRLR